MLIYPETPLPEVPVKVQTIHDIIRTEISFSTIYRRRKSLRKKRIFTLNYVWLNKEDLNILYNFYNEVQEGDGIFLYISHSEYSWNNEYIAKVVDNTIKEYELPVYTWDRLTIKINGVEVVDYEIYKDKTISERKLIKFNTALNIGDLITCDFKNGKVALYCEIEESSIGIEHLVAGYTNIRDLVITEVLNT